MRQRKLNKKQVSKLINRSKAESKKCGDCRFFDKSFCYAGYVKPFSNDDVPISQTGVPMHKSERICYKFKLKNKNDKK